MTNHTNQYHLQKDLRIVSCPPHLIVLVVLIKDAHIYPPFHQRMDRKLQGARLPGISCSSRETGNNTVCG